jgi:hypothetical protein
MATGFNSSTYDPLGGLYGGGATTGSATTYSPTPKPPTGQYGSATSSAPATAPSSTLTAWGATPDPYLEQLYSSMGGAYQQQTPLQSLYANNSYGNPLASEQLGNLYGTPTASENLAGQAQGLYLQPTASGSANSYAQGIAQQTPQLIQNGGALESGYNGANNVQNYYNQTQGQYLGPTETAKLDGTIGNYYSTANDLQSYMAQNGGGFTQPTESALAGQQIAGLYGSANGLQQFAGNQSDALNGPGAMEQFASSAMNNTNPYLDMVAQRGRAAIDQAAAARGAYGSGGALASLGNYQAASDAEQFKYMADVQNSGQQAQLQRLGLGADVYGRADAGRLAQGQGLQSLAGQQYNERMTGLTGGAQASNLAGQESIRQGTAIQGLSGQEFAERLAQLAGGTSAAGAASSERLAQTNGLAALYANQYNQQLAGAQLGVGAASAADNARMAQLSGLTNMTQAGSQSELARLAGQVSQAQASDASTLSRYGLQQNLAQNTSTSNLNYLNSMFTAAGAAQGAGQTRENAMFGQQFSMDSLMAQLYGGFYQNGGQMSGEAGIAGINAGANAAQLNGQAQTAQDSLPFKLLK